MNQVAGIDVSLKKLKTAASDEFEVNNTPQGHQEVIRKLTTRGQTVRVCLEATGGYELDLALALHRAPGIEVMVVNPKAARHFAQALMQRSKTDPVDARILREYAQRMDFQCWSPPSTERLQLRTLGRRITAVVEMRTQEKNRLHAAQSSEELEFIRDDIQASIQQFEARTEGLEKKAADLINQHPRLQASIARLISVKGIAFASAVRLYGELCVLPRDLTPRQWVAHAGLDPRHVESGTFQGKTRISKAGNKYLRAALYMPAHNSILFEPNVAAFNEKLLSNGKAKMQAKVAVMRKLLHSIHGMLRHQTDFDGERFYALA